MGKRRGEDTAAGRNMRVRDEQVASLSTSAEAEFVDRLVRFLKEHYPNAARESDATLRPFAATQRQRATLYDLTTERQVATYVACAWVLGPRFDVEDGEAGPILTSPLNTAEGKANWLGHRADAKLAESEASAPNGTPGAVASGEGQA